MALLWRLYFLQLFSSPSATLSTLLLRVVLWEQLMLTRSEIPLRSWVWESLEVSGHKMDSVCSLVDTHLQGMGGETLGDHALLGRVWEENRCSEVDLVRLACCMLNLNTYLFTNHVFILFNCCCTYYNPNIHFLHLSFQQYCREGLLSTKFWYFYPTWLQLALRYRLLIIAELLSRICNSHWTLSGLVLLVLS